PLISCTAMELDEDCSIILELPDSDPLYNDKKNLLQMKGFKTRVPVHLKSFEHPDIGRTSLQEMLQISRIINLDEVELYFLEDDVSSPVEFYSPRNEIVSLNSILKLVENSLSSCTQELRKCVLHKCKVAIVNMIGDVSDKICMKSVVVEDHSCVKENCLLQWGKDNGVKTRLQIAYVKGAGRGATAREDLKVGDTALEIPASLIISEGLVQNSDMYHILEKVDGMASETMLLLWSMKEKYNQSSKFKFYFDMLPEEFHTGLSFGVQALMVLDETVLLDEIVQAKEHLQSQYDELIPSLCKKHPDIFPPHLYTWEKFLWACELWYSNSMQIMFPDGKLRTCLIPIAGFLNHSLYPHIINYGRVDSTTNTLKFCLSRPCSAGEECLLSYGNFSSSHLVTFYGFLPKGDNPYDVIIPVGIEDITLEDDYEDDSSVENPSSDGFSMDNHVSNDSSMDNHVSNDSSMDKPESNDSSMDIPSSFDDAIKGEGDSLSNLTTHMVRGTWFSKYHDIFHYGLPSRFLDYLRRARNPKLHTKTHESLETEVEVLQKVHDYFDDMMERLGDPYFDG
ncbi:hypothetical protein UlMin_004350, partial [Ulmus minor]